MFYYLQIDIDFNLKHGDNVWLNAQSKLVGIISKQTTSPNIKSLLRNYNALVGVQKELAVLKGLHALLYNGKKYNILQDNRKQATKLSIDTTLKFFLTICATENSIHIDMERWKLFAKNLGLQVKPVIICIGTSMENIHQNIFFLHFDS